MGKLVVLLVTAFVDMLGGAIVFPLIPFLAQKVIGHGPLWTALDSIGMGGVGVAVSLLLTTFAVAQLVSAPFWGRVSDKIGRRPALMIGLGASVIAYVVFAFAHSLELLLLCRLVQGAGGGTVGVVQAYVADATKPEDRAKSLGWVSAATNAGVAMGPAIGIWVLGFGVNAQALARGAAAQVPRAGTGRGDDRGGEHGVRLVLPEGVARRRGRAGRAERP